MMASSSSPSTQPPAFVSSTPFFFRHASSPSSTLTTSRHSTTSSFLSCRRTPQPTHWLGHHHHVRSSPTVSTTTTIQMTALSTNETSNGDTSSSEQTSTVTTPSPPCDWPDLAEVSANTAVMSQTIMSSEDILKVLPHRYPFLLVDRVVAFEAGKRAIGVKSVTINEPFFPGHFPNKPIMPGVLQVEALAQLGGLIMLQMPMIENPLETDFFFGGVDKVKWRRPVVPGDTLVMEMTLETFKQRFGIVKMSGRAFVNGELVVEGLFTLVMIMNKKK